MRQFLEERSILIDSQMSELLQTGDPMEDVRQEQKVLNLKKELLSKMDKLRAKHQEKQDAWSKFLDLLEEHRKKEKVKHNEDLRVLNEAMAETQKEINQIVLKESTADGDAGMTAEEREKHLLRLQLAKSNAIIQDLQSRVDSYVARIPKENPAFNENSPQMIKEPTMVLPGEESLEAAAAARAARAKLFQRANATLLEAPPPLEEVRSQSQASSAIAFKRKEGPLLEWAAVQELEVLEAKLLEEEQLKRLHQQRQEHMSMLNAQREQTLREQGERRELSRRWRMEAEEDAQRFHQD
eukprot:g27.t1